MESGLSIQGDVHRTVMEHADIPYRTDERLSCISQIMRARQILGNSLCSQLETFECKYLLDKIEKKKLKAIYETQNQP